MWCGEGSSSGGALLADRKAPPSSSHSSLKSAMGKSSSKLWGACTVAAIYQGLIREVADTGLEACLIELIDLLYDSQQQISEHECL